MQCAGGEGRLEAQQKGNSDSDHVSERHAGFQVKTVAQFLAHLFCGHLSIFIEIHVFKQAGRRILVPHKQVTCGQAVLSRYQLHLKEQDSTARDTPG